MGSILKSHHGMNIVGQGVKIILFMLPALAGAILLHVYLPRAAALPAGLGPLRIVGYVWLLPGLALWATAVWQLLVGFPRGELLTTGAYGVVRNPIYASVTLFILPAVTMITLTWVYLVPAAFLYAGVMIFIRTEEKQLLAAFGPAYADYLARVDRLVPLKRP